MNLASVNILLSTYNGEKYIRRQLDSIFSQTFSDFILYVRDDGSTDDTIKILESYQRQYANLNVTLGQNLGAAQSFIELLKHADSNAQFFAFSDQDDVWKPDKLERAIRHMEKNPLRTSLLYFSRFEIVDENLNRLGDSPLYTNIGFTNALVQNVATGCTMLLNQSARNLILSKIPNQMIMHDWWIYLVIAAFGKLIYDPEPRILYRQHSGNAIGTTSNFFEKMIRHWKSFTNGKSVLFKISNQAELFYRLYGERLSSKQKKILANFLESKSSFLRRLMYLFDFELRRNSLIDNVILKTVILLNRH